MNYIETKYNFLSSKVSDINEHLPILYNYAKNCEKILELGVRGCVSSWAFCKGLLENNSNKKHLLLNDIEKCDIDELVYITKDTDINLEYLWINDLEINISENVDLTFIDTWHIYGQLIRELNKFSKITNKYIIMHDTTIDEIYGESIRMNMNIKQQSIQSGYPINEITVGLGKAIEEFLINNNNWRLKEKFTNNCGLTILERVY